MIHSHAGMFVPIGIALQYYVVVCGVLTLELDFLALFCNLTRDRSSTIFFYECHMKKKKKILVSNQVFSSFIAMDFW